VLYHLSRNDDSTARGLIETILAWLLNHVAPSARTYSTAIVVTIFHTVHCCGRKSGISSCDVSIWRARYMITWRLQTHKNIINLRWVASGSTHYCLATPHRRHLYINQLIHKQVKLKLSSYLITKPINVKDIQSNKNVITSLLEYSTKYHL
jgi:hypothetical protein